MPSITEIRHADRSFAPEDEPLAESLRTKLRTIVDRPLTTSSLLALEKTARLVRELLITGQDPKALLSVGGSAANVSLDMQSYGPAALAPSAPAETFAATFIREIVPAVSAAIAPKPATPSLFDVVTAIAYAKERNLPGLADRLEREFFDRFELGPQTPESDPALPAPDPCEHHDTPEEHDAVVHS